MSNIRPLSSLGSNVSNQSAAGSWGIHIRPHGWRTPWVEIKGNDNGLSNADGEVGRVRWGQTLMKEWEFWSREGLKGVPEKRYDVGDVGLVEG